MKKTISAILVCVVLMGTLFTLTSCGKMLMGKYKAEYDLGIGTVSETLEFGLFGKVTITSNSLGKETVKEGKYEFNDDGDKITFTFENEDGTPDVTTMDFSSGEKDGKKFIELSSGLMTVTYYQAK